MPENKRLLVRKSWIMGKYAEMKVISLLTWVPMILSTLGWFSLRELVSYARHCSLPQMTFSCLEVTYSNSRGNQTMLL